MKSWLAVFTGLFVLAAAAQAADPPRWLGTGDRKLDTTLEQIDARAKADPDGFFQQVSARYGVPEQDIRQAKETHGLGAADVFLATALARATNRPVLGVAEQYKKNQGRGWGVVAKEMGVKPGSPAFHELKQGARGSLDHLKARQRERQRHEAQVRREHGQQEKLVKQGKGPGKGR